jgi:hypothetical protein
MDKSMAGNVHCCDRRAQVWWFLLVLAVGVSTLVCWGCGRRGDIHPALRVEGEDLERAKKRGCSLVNQGADPYEAYQRGMQDINTRVSAHVILRSAGCCWPQDEVAFQIAQRGDSSDAGVRLAVREALKTAERELKFAVVVQMPKDRDPAEVEFLLRAIPGVEYPALLVEEPYYLRDADSYYDENAPASAMYYYVVKFPVRGGHGIPPIGPQVSTLNLVVRDGELEATAIFRMPRPRPTR